MPSTYSPSLKLQLIGTGEQAGTWGTTTNYNLGTLLEQAITGVVTIPMGDATYTLTNYNGLSDEARNAVLVLQGPITAPQNVIIPPQQKVYIVRNRTGNTVTLTANVGGVNVSVANAASEVLFCDGSNVYSATQFNYINGDLTVSGTAYANNIVSTNNITLGKDLFANASTGQVYLPTGDQNTRTSSPIVGLIRYNTTGQFYEGYTNVAWVRFTVAPQGNYTITYAIAAGGGGGGGNSGGGGGAGGLTQNTLVASPGTVYTMTIGAGGVAGANGNDSSIVGVATTTGGGRGGSFGPGNGASGGSGGGGSGVQPNQTSYGGAGTTSQGFAGGGSGTDPHTATGGGGGGGSQAAGQQGPFGNGGYGGSGTTLTITGVPLAVCGGGGGCAAPYSAGSGGSGGAGGGGNGSAFYGTASAGGVNTGGGGGGGSTGGAGGSGVIYISMPTVSFSGVYTGLPTITSYGSTTVLKFTNSGTYTA